MLTTFVFALWPLAVAREVSPASLFRSLVAPSHRWPRRRYLLMLAAAVATLVALAIVGVPQPTIGAWFVLTVIVAVALLWGLTRLVVLAARRVAHRGGFALRLALANLHRPGSASPRVIMALGAGVTVLAAIAVLATNLRNEVALRLPTRAPAIYLIDVQPDQRQVLEDTLAEMPGARLDQLLPSLRARIVRIAGRPVAEVQVAPNVAWTVSRDRGFTYAATLPEGSELVEGSWWPADYQGPPQVSIDEEIAKGYGVGVGDTLTFNVLGRTIEAQIANIRREVDWSGGRLDFLFVVDPAALAGAPHTFVASADVAAADEARLLDLLATRLPNVTPIAIREVVARATEVLGRVELAVDIVAGLTLGGGILALAGGILAARAAPALRDRGAQGAGAQAPGADAGLPGRVSGDRRGRGCRGRAAGLAGCMARGDPGDGPALVPGPAAAGGGAAGGHRRRPGGWRRQPVAADRPAGGAGAAQRLTTPAITCH